jgi:hypothetical protein
MFRFAPPKPQDSYPAGIERLAHGVAEQIDRSQFSAVFLYL